MANACVQALYALFLIVAHFVLVVVIVVVVPLLFVFCAIDDCVAAHSFAHVCDFARALFCNRIKMLVVCNGTMLDSSAPL